MSETKRVVEGGAAAVEQPEELKVPCEVYSRIVGYLRPVQAWNDGKRQEFAERQTFKAPEAADKPG